MSMRAPAPSMKQGKRAPAKTPLEGILCSYDSLTASIEQVSGFTLTVRLSQSENPA
jgi:hypothetical protein